MTKSSINIQKANNFAFLHNSRESIVSYVIRDARNNEYSKNGKEAYQYYRNLLKEAISNYTRRTGQRIQTDDKKFLWEAIININKNHTLKNVQVFARVLQMKYQWQVVQIAIHRDEGRKDPNSGKNIYNYHAHIVFFMLDKQGIYRFKKRDFGIKRMQELQTLTARVLKMERGISKKKTNKVRLEHPQYRYMEQEKERMSLELNNLSRVLRRMEEKYESNLLEFSLELNKVDIKYADLYEENNKLKKELGIPKGIEQYELNSYIKKL